MAARKALAAAAIAAALVTTTPGTAGAEPGELLGNGWRETDDGVVHCTIDANHVVCDRYGPGLTWYAQGAVEMWFPEQCVPVGFFSGAQGSAPAVIRLGNLGDIGCALGVYPSSTQAFAAVINGRPVAYSGMLALRVRGTNGGGPGVTMNAVQHGSQLDIIIS